MNRILYIFLFIIGAIGMPLITFSTLKYLESQITRSIIKTISEDIKFLKTELPNATKYDLSKIPELKRKKMKPNKLLSWFEEHIRIPFEGIFYLLILVGFVCWIIGFRITSAPLALGIINSGSVLFATGITNVFSDNVNVVFPILIAITICVLWFIKQSRSKRY